MGPETVVTLIGVAVIVAALAFYLITVALILRHVSFTVGTILIGVRAIAHQLAPIGGVVREIVSDVRAIEEDFEALLAADEEETVAGRRR